MTMDIGKRKLLKISSIAATSAMLPGCALLDLVFNSRSPTDILCEDGSYPVVDSHAHFFNASDIQAGQYLSGPVLNDFVDFENFELIKLALQLVGRVIQRGSSMLAPTAEDELKILRRNNNLTKSTLVKKTEFSYLTDDYQTVSKDFFDSLTNLERQQFQIEIQNTNKLERQKLNITDNKKLAESVEPVILNEETLYKAMTGESAANLLEDERRQKSSILIGLSVLMLDDVLSFIMRMLSKRSSNLAEYQYAYSKEQSNSFVLHSTDVLVDFDYWLGCEHNYTSSIESQIELHKQLHLLTNKFTLPILGVNPMKLVHHGNDYKDLIKSAIVNSHFKGIKIYPTLGYSPNGDLYNKLDRPFSTCGYPKQPTTQQIQKALYDIYDICLENNAVVMAHSNNSKGSPKTASKLAGPTYWAKVFQNKSYIDLKVNFGHMGGYSSSTESGWNIEFLKLMREGNRYGDVGHWFDEGYSKELKALFSNAKNIIGSDFDQRLLYGTDWFMLTTSSKWKSYLKNTTSAFDTLISRNFFSSEDEGKQAKDRFFYKNASELFGSSVRSCKK
jgi:predicted TIM-barrel fold metal-dependent hydrolase